MTKTKANRHERAVSNRVTVNKNVCIGVRNVAKHTSREAYNVNRDRGIGSLLLYRGLKINSVSETSIPAASLKHSFRPDPANNCVVCAQLHKKRRNNSPDMAGLKRFNAIEVRY